MSAQSLKEKLERIIVAEKIRFLDREPNASRSNIAYKWIFNSRYKFPTSYNPYWPLPKSILFDWADYDISECHRALHDSAIRIEARSATATDFSTHEARKTARLRLIDVIESAIQLKLDVSPNPYNICHDDNEVNFYKWIFSPQYPKFPFQRLSIMSKNEYIDLSNALDASIAQGPGVRVNKHIQVVSWPSEDTVDIDSHTVEDTDDSDADYYPTKLDERNDESDSDGCIIVRGSGSRRPKSRRLGGDDEISLRLKELQNEHKKLENRVIQAEQLESALRKEISVATKESHLASERNFLHLITLAKEEGKMEGFSEREARNEVQNSAIELPAYGNQSVEEHNYNASTSPASLHIFSADFILDHIGAVNKTFNMIKYADREYQLVPWPEYICVNLPTQPYSPKAPSPKSADQNTDGALVYFDCRSVMGKKGESYPVLVRTEEDVLYIGHFAIDSFIKTTSDFMEQLPEVERIALDQERVRNQVPPTYDTIYICLLNCNYFDEKAYHVLVDAHKLHQKRLALRSTHTVGSGSSTGDIGSSLDRFDAGQGTLKRKDRSHDEAARKDFRAPKRTALSEMI